MSDNSHQPFLARARRRTLTLTAGAAVLAVTGICSGIATASAGPTPQPSKIVGSGRPVSHVQVAGTAITLAAGQYGSGTVTCPVGTEVFGGGESNTAPGTLVLTDSWPSSNTSWLVYVKNNSGSTYSFTPYAVCR
jgi:hypothetical protein